VSTPSVSRILPYSLLVGQEQLKIALELTFVAPRIGGVLISGDRGTGKSTAVRAFSHMMHGRLPVTLPINATDDRVIGGWQLDELMLHGRPKWQPGLLEQASDRGVLYIDEVNLLDDHVVNLILDAASTGQLPVQREGRDEEVKVSFALLGTMNPEEGGLRPQLLDRFGLMVDVRAEADRQRRGEILRTVLVFDEALASPKSEASGFLRGGEQQDKQRADELRTARTQLYQVAVSEDIAARCGQLAERVQALGHRGEYVMALAARAQAALQGSDQVSVADLKTVARMALQHRRAAAGGGQSEWTKADDAVVDELLGEPSAARR